MWKDLKEQKQSILNNLQTKYDESNVIIYGLESGFSGVGWYDNLRVKKIENLLVTCYVVYIPKKQD